MAKALKYIDPVKNMMTLLLGKGMSFPEVYDAAIGIEEMFAKDLAKVQAEEIQALKQAKATAKQIDARTADFDRMIEIFMQRKTAAMQLKQEKWVPQ
jgi:hypothetical protein